MPNSKFLFENFKFENLKMAVYQLIVNVFCVIIFYNLYHLLFMYFPHKINTDRMFVIEFRI